MYGFCIFYEVFYIFVFFFALCHFFVGFVISKRSFFERIQSGRGSFVFLFQISKGFFLCLIGAVFTRIICGQIAVRKIDVHV